MKNSVVIMVLIAIVFAGGGFFAGTKYQQGQAQAQRAQLAGQFGNRAGGTGAGRTGAGRGGQVVGTILGQNNSSITVKTADGGSKIVLLLGTTSINKATAGAVADLTVGTKVAVFGTTNTDGSVTATNVQINPVVGMGAGAPSGPAPSGTATNK
jgi:hypothetical protein